jgi:hypothetical protein
LLDTAVAAGALTKNGAHFYYQGKSIGNGRERARAALLETASLRGALLEETLALMWSGAPLLSKASSEELDVTEEEARSAA